MKRFSKKSWILVGAIAAALAAAVGSFAYFTSTGSGSGTATVGTSSGTITVAGTAAGVLYPGSAGVDVTFTASNPAGFQQKLTTIHLASVTAPVGCDVTAFTMPDVTVGSDGTLAGNTVAAALTETGTLSMTDSADSQDACKDAVLALGFTTS